MEYFNRLLGEQQTKERIETLASATEQRQRESRDAISKLGGQLTVLGANLESRLTQGEQQTREKLGETMTVLQQQTAVLHRAIGKIIPIELPERLIKKLAALETRIGDKNSWPKDSTEADAMLAELSDLVRQIPPWAEEDLLPQLNRLRWGTSSLTLVGKVQTTTSDALGDFLDGIETAIEAKPDGASEVVLRQLTDDQSKLRAKFDAFRRDSAFADAERLLKNGPAPAEFSEALERLSEWTGVPEFKERVQKLQNELRARAIADEASKFTVSVDASFLRANEETNQTLRQILLSGILGSVLSQRQILQENSDATKSLIDRFSARAELIEQRIEAESKAQAAQQDKRQLDYQRWALSQIQKFNSAVSVDEQGAKGTFGSSPDYPEIQADMVRFLVPISVPHLDPAVSRLYSEAFERGWRLLDSKNQKYLQTIVAEQEAVVKKRKP